jgi:MoxR-like ATPase
MLQGQVQELNERVKAESEFAREIMAAVGEVIVGQKYMIERLLIGLLADGHVLLEGVPGLAKTLAVKTLAGALHGDFKRIQFTPDLLPADLTGTLIYNPREGTFAAKKGPVFANFVLADEINRAPAKVQSALLEAMQEHQVTIGDETYRLPDPFLVMATQNPIEQEGTYQLPEAQVDRFMLKLRVGYPTREEEHEILDMHGSRAPQVRRVVELARVLQAREVVRAIYMDEKIKEYIVRLVLATREPQNFGLNLGGLIAYGASPRATLCLTQASRAHAFLRGRGYVTPEDVKAIALDVLRHRIIVTYEAEAEEVSSDEVAQRILNQIEVP